MAPMQTQTQIATMNTPAKSGERQRLRSTLRKWKDSLKKDKELLPTPTPGPTSSSLSPRHIPAITNTTSPTLQLLRSDPPLPDDIALFGPTTQTYIHSPLDKRNKASNSSSPTSTLRKSYLGTRGSTAPADSFALVTDSAAASAMEEGKMSGNKAGAGKARRSSRLMAPLFLKSRCSERESGGCGGCDQVGQVRRRRQAGAWTSEGGKPTREEREVNYDIGRSRGWEMG